MVFRIWILHKTILCSKGIQWETPPPSPQTIQSEPHNAPSMSPKEGWLFTSPKRDYEQQKQ